MGEIVRGGCSFAMMRNAFVADSALSSPEGVLAAIRHELDRLSHRSDEAVRADREALLARIQASMRTSTPAVRSGRCGA